MEILAIFLVLMLNILKNYMIYIVIYCLYQKERKLISAVSLSAICMIEKLCFSHKSFKTSTKAWHKTKKSS